MTNDPLVRALPVAFAFTLIGLTAFWGGWMVLTQGAPAAAAPFALIAALWPALSFTFWSEARPGIGSDAVSPGTGRKAGHEPGAEFAGLHER